MIEKNQNTLQICNVQETPVHDRWKNSKLIPQRSTTPVCDLGSLQHFSHLSFSRSTGYKVGMSTSNRWSCTSLGAGLKHVDDAALDSEEKQILAELEDPFEWFFFQKIIAEIGIQQPFGNFSFF